jgi:hypothetical protein
MLTQYYLLHDNPRYGVTISIATLVAFITTTLSDLLLLVLTCILYHNYHDKFNEDMSSCSTVYEDGISYTWWSTAFMVLFLVSFFHICARSPRKYMELIELFAVIASVGSTMNIIMFSILYSDATKINKDCVTALLGVDYRFIAIADSSLYFLLNSAVNFIVSLFCAFYCFKFN